MKTLLILSIILLYFIIAVITTASLTTDGTYDDADFEPFIIGSLWPISLPIIGIIYLYVICVKQTIKLITKIKNR